MKNNEDIAKTGEQISVDGDADTTDILYVEELPDQTDLALPAAAGTLGSFACLGSASCPASTASTGSTASSASAA